MCFAVVGWAASGKPTLCGGLSSAGTCPPLTQLGVRTSKSKANSRAQRPPLIGELYHRIPLQRGSARTVVRPAHLGRQPRLCRRESQVSVASRTPAVRAHDRHNDRRVRTRRKQQVLASGARPDCGRRAGDRALQPRHSGSAHQAARRVPRCSPPVKPAVTENVVSYPK